MDTSKNGNLWQATSRERIEAPFLENDLNADLVVIGGGYTGCSAALHAAKAGQEVVLLEAETIGHGGSGRNVGFVNAGLWLPPDTVESIMGEAAGIRLNAALAGAPDLVFSLIEEHAIDCEAVRHGTLHCAHAESAVADLRSRHDQMARRGAPVTLLDREETERRIGTSAFAHALHDARAGTIQPLAYCRGLARAAGEAGARIHEQSPVLKVERRDGAWLVSTARGSVKGGSLLMATNAYQTPVTGTSQNAYTPVHYFQLATRPLSPNLEASILPDGEGCWDTASIMTSLRKDAQGRVIVGGMGSLDHATSGFHRGWARRKLAGLFPALSDQPLEHAWFGRIAMTSDHIPKIVRFGPDALSIFGYSGRGIAPGTLFGAKAAEVLTGAGDEVLPVAQISSYTERFTGARGVFFELAAGLYHLSRR